MFGFCAGLLSGTLGDLVNAVEAVVVLDVEPRALTGHNEQ